MTRGSTAWLDTGLPTECPCQWGMTGHCFQDRHGTCTAHTVELPEAYLTLPGGSYGPSVWLADRVCRWRCACECHQEPEPENTPHPAPDPEPEPEQLAFF